MKIYYINGYNGENSNKPKILENMLNTEIKHIVYDYSKNNIKEIEELSKDADLIIASSTGAYIARTICFNHNIPLVSLNPVIDLDKTFKKLNVKTPNIPRLPDNYLLSEIVFVTEDDELIDHRETFLKFPTRTKIYPGTHRFETLNLIKNDLLEFIKYTIL